ncbi:hypothetical protein F2Q69_00020825, partial [Brassica cretica]
DDDAQSSASHLSESKTSEADEGNTRPPRVKASKARRKKTIEGKGLSEFQTIWYIKQQDMAMKERLSKMSLLGSLIAKREPLSECEEALKKKLINDLLAVYVYVCVVCLSLCLDRLLEFLCSCSPCLCLLFLFK